VNWCNGCGELLCRTGVGKVRGRLEIDTELIGNDITLERSLVLHIRVCDVIQCLVLRQAFGELPLTVPCHTLYTIRQGEVSSGNSLSVFVPFVNSK
jgi:hypothetical protein